ncbi:MAG: 1-phosphofructokinase family hexose kinase [Anaerolineaceae bacterium]|jgi:1-phosphofructokinase family hexose kinase|nr:1-phosphofructokinase family hexose kinase [Anaerolineaceae bacterium]HNX46713.1 1-phosphofructokinase family hexose kinase [Anaerolineaceae bacterium]HPT23270.1 1-phosphofructokinase family hexose kinase [Anaerolineaceae bacterium]
MIITLTPNPSVDRTLQIEKLRFNEVLRTDKAHIDWGGKGFNVSRALRIIGYDSLALAWVGGGTGRMVEQGLNKLGIQTDFNWVEEETRTNTVAREAGGEWYIRLNEPGPHIPPEAIQALLDKASAYAKADDVWVASGSLPQDVPDDFYARLIRILNQAGARVFFNANDEPLRLGMQENPFLLRLNEEDSQHLAGHPIRHLDDAKRAALSFLRQRVPHVCFPYSEQNFILASQKEMVISTAPKVEPRNLMGAGDALLAGLVHGFEKKLPLTETLRWAAGFGTVWLSHDTNQPVTREDISAMLPRIDVRLISVL